MPLILQNRTKINEKSGKKSVEKIIKVIKKLTRTFKKLKKNYQKKE